MRAAGLHPAHTSRVGTPVPPTGSRTGDGTPCAHTCAGTATILDAARRVDSATLRHEPRRLRRALVRWNSESRVQLLLPGLAAALRVHPAPAEGA